MVVLSAIHRIVTQQKITKNSQSTLQPNISAKSVDKKEQQTEKLLILQSSLLLTAISVCISKLKRRHAINTSVH